MWASRTIITSRIGFTGGSRFKWAGREPRGSKDKRTLVRYACVGSCGMRFKSRAVERTCRQCGGALEGRGPA